MSLYVVPRATQDFDFIVHLKPKDVNEFVSSFQEGYYCDKESVQEAVKTRGMFNIIDHASGFKADIMVLKNEEYRQTEFTRRTAMDFYGRTIYAVSPEDLLLSKLIWIQNYQWSQQIADIKNLAEIDEMDWKYIREWIDKLKLNTFDLLHI